VSAFPPPILSARAVSRSYGHVAAVSEASLDLRPGRMTCLLGPSGCGKSTLLRLIAGLEPLDGGEIEAAGRILSQPGRTVAPEDRGIGLVFQDYALFPHLTAAQNVAFGLRKVGARERRERAVLLLDQFKLAERADAWPHTLSGGEQQRVAIARALARQPAAILLDEPFSGLDGDLKAEVRHAVLSGLRQARAAVLIVTHDPEEALLMADDLALMAEGRVVQCGTPQECYLRPGSIAAARLLGETNLLPATVGGGIAETDFGEVAAPSTPDGPAMVMVRPEGLWLSSDGAPAEVVSVRFGGAFYEVTLRANGTEVVLRHFDNPPAPLDEVKVRLDPLRVQTFPINH
jgi:iron(III) transport system ATP-binding protein